MDATEWWLKCDACEESSKEKFPFHLTAQPETSISAFYSPFFKVDILLRNLPIMWVTLHAI